MMPWDWPMMITGSAPRSAAAYLSFFSIAASDDSTPPKAEMMQFNVAARLSGAARHSGPKNNPAVLQLVGDAVFPGCLVGDVGVSLSLFKNQ
jgi:hypothetical protein